MPTPQHAELRLAANKPLKVPESGDSGTPMQPAFQAATIGVSPQVTSLR